MNEILLVLSLLVIYGSVLLVYRLFGKSGLASYVIFIITSIADTPFVYLARKMHEKGSIPEGQQ